MGDSPEYPGNDEYQLHESTEGWWHRMEDEESKPAKS